MVNTSLVATQRELLISLRSALVGSGHTLPFTIYTDETIEDLLTAQPKTIEQLSAVKGFPKDGKRVKGFGEHIIRIFTEPERIASVTISTNPGANGLEVKTNLRSLDVF